MLYPLLSLNYWYIEIEKLSQTRKPDAAATLLLGCERKALTQAEATNLVLNAFLTRGDICTGVWIRCRKFCSIKDLAADTELGDPDFRQGDVDMWLSDTSGPR
jgi:hypothetical protein